MGMRNFVSIMMIACALTVGFSSVVMAGADRYLKKGYIRNESGEKCRYVQRTDRNNMYFYGKKHTVGTITFDDPKCMSAGELGDLGISINKMMINNIISKWYSHNDANFMTKESELFNGSLMQKKGKCIYSKKYPKVVGIAVEYFIKNNSIYSMIHGQSLMGCTK